MIKPFRLINSVELKMLEQHFSLLLLDWNKQYSLMPLTLKRVLPAKEYCSPQLKCVVDHDPLALIDEHYLTLVNQALFGENSSCFNPASQELFCTLLNQFFKVNQCSIHHCSNEIPDWFYPGSTCLLLIISCNNTDFTLVLNPTWVYQNLPQKKRQGKMAHTFDEALSEQKINLNLELTPFSLPLQQLINLEVGDVLVTDHPITTSVRLMHKEKLLAQAELGQSLPCKSIVLKRSS